jgi:uncharacterized phage protein (TIGR01671 family)
MEIRFRGKLLPENQSPLATWAYGYLTVSIGGINKIHCQDNDGKWFDFQVQPDTVGRFIGLCDKNGIAIYEDDIVKCLGHIKTDSIRIIFWDNITGKVVWNNLYCCFEIKSDTTYTFPRYKMEIIGNVHDNPDLLTD